MPAPVLLTIMARIPLVTGLRAASRAGCGCSRLPNPIFRPALQPLGIIARLGAASICGIATTAGPPLPSPEAETAPQTGAHTPPPKDTCPTGPAPPRPAHNSAHTVLYVTGLDYKQTAEDVAVHLAADGAPRPRWVRIVRDYRGTSRGFAFVSYRTAEDAQKAIAVRNDSFLQGRKIKLKPRSDPPPVGPGRELTTREKSRPPPPPSTTLFVHNLSPEASITDINNIVRHLPNVVDARMSISLENARRRGFFHVEFVDMASARAARDSLSGTVMYGMPLLVEFSGTRVEERRASRRNHR